jgi:NTP pyrophosphatase (non-canonical NTP hydrolase)
VEAELADILIYLVRIADKLDVNLYRAALAKLQHNSEKYPADQVRGLSKKYNEYP